eukprot:RCo054854
MTSWARSAAPRRTFFRHWLRVTRPWQRHLLWSDLRELSRNSDALMKQTASVTASVTVSKSASIVILVVVICGSLVLSTFGAILIVGVVRRLSCAMRAAAEMEMER